MEKILITHINDLINIIIPSQISKLLFNGTFENTNEARNNIIKSLEFDILDFIRKWEYKNTNTNN